jgi:hypothetical protein
MIGKPTNQTCASSNNASCEVSTTFESDNDFTNDGNGNITNACVNDSLERANYGFIKANIKIKMRMDLGSLP